jgi:phosphoribosylamine--glycine ligase
MGAVSPLPFFDETLRTKVIQQVIEPTIIGLMEDNMPYKGFIFFGLMISDGEPYMIEYNCRLGDPETEVVIPRLQTDLVTLFQSMHSQTLHTQQIQLDPRSAAAVVAVSGGYPGDYKTGMAIDGLDQPPLDDCLVFHAGTKMDKNEVLTNGGRVLVVAAMGDNIRESAELANYMMEQIHFDDLYHRPDIGFEFIPAD